MTEEIDYDLLVEEKVVCRDIVNEINKFGVSDRQIVFIVQLLAMQFEDVQLMKSVVSLIRESMDKKLYVVDSAEESEETSNDTESEELRGKIYLS